MVLDDLPDVPPAVSLLISEFHVRPRTYEDLIKRLRRLLPELRTQSEWYLSNRPESASPRSASKLDIYVDGGLNLFDREAGCPEIRCRMESATRLCRSVGLLADTVWMADHFSWALAEFGRATDEKVRRLLDDTLILAELEPLIADGIVRFVPAGSPLCLTCGAELERQITKVTDHLMAMFESEFSIGKHAGRMFLDTGDMASPPVIFMPDSTYGWDSSKFINVAWLSIREAVSRAVWTSYRASTGSGAVFSNSKAGMAALAYKEGNASNANNLRLLEGSREITLPWVNQLSPAQVVQLRNEASKALPAFRECLAMALEATPRKPEAVQETIADLREQAVEVRGELDDTKQHAGRFWKTSYMTLGFGVSAYGIGTGQTLPALSGLLPLLQLMVAHKTGTEKDLEQLKRRPGYVLVKAQEILDHAHGG